MYKQVASALIVVAHPDDEVIGMGGTLAKLASEGVKVTVAFLSSGVGSRNHEGEREAATRKQAAVRCCETLGAVAGHFGSYPTLQFDSVPSLNLAKTVSELVARYTPDLVFTHHGGDLNVDHRLTTQAVMVACRPQPSSQVTGLYSFAVLSSSGWGHESLFPTFQPDTYINVEDHVETALAAYQHYQAEVREEPHARSVTSLRLRMQQNGRQVGLYAADAFQTLRVVSY